MPRPDPIGLRHEVLTLAREGIRHSDIAARVGIARRTVIRNLRRHAIMGNLEPGKSTGPPHKTSARQDGALFRMVRQDRYKSARFLT